MAPWACRWPSWRCRCTCSCPTTTPRAFGIPLATLGALLLGARLLDALADPWIGRCLRPLAVGIGARAPGRAAVAALLLARASTALFFPAVQGRPRCCCGARRCWP
jgi:hypothetical protein